MIDVKFTFENYSKFCKDLELKPSHYISLKIFHEYCNGDLDIIFRIGDLKDEKI